ncbi:MAG: SurA N-terminal domain-containing protein, partial [Pseudomonadota bacterium]
MKILAVLLCTAALGGCSLFSKKPAPAPAAAPASAPAATALNTTPAAPAKADKPDGKGGFLPPGESGNVAIDSIVVVVNDDVITQRELSNRIKTVTARMKAQNVQMPDPADLRRQLLERMIVERAQLQMAKEMGVRVDDLQLDRSISRIAEAQKLTVQDLRNPMEKDGTPFAAFREEIREEI